MTPQGVSLRSYAVGFLNEKNYTCQTDVIFVDILPQWFSYTVIINVHSATKFVSLVAKEVLTVKYKFLWVKKLKKQTFPLIMQPKNENLKLTLEKRRKHFDLIRFDYVLINCDPFLSFLFLRNFLKNRIAGPEIVAPLPAHGISTFSSVAINAIINAMYSRPKPLF